jgi:anthranilate/para-aminobenzoate synthase component I
MYATRSASHLTAEEVRTAVLATGRPGWIWLETQSPDPAGRFAWMAAGHPRAWYRPSAANGRATPADWQFLVNTWRQRPSWRFGVLSYDLKSVFEPTVPQPTSPRPDEPDFLFFEPSWVLHSDGTSTTWQGHPDFSYADFERWWEEMKAQAADPLPSGIPADTVPMPLSHGRALRAPSDTEYVRAAEHLQAAMRRGDIYEANLCLRWEGEGEFDAAAVYRRWSHQAQPPQGGCAWFPGAAVVCGSPERYLQVVGKKVLSRPIKGTAPRHPHPETDAQTAHELALSPKERAENTMVVDVVRNDLSRVAVPGSVAVSQWCVVESYPTLHQMVSTVEATLSPSHDVWDAVAASFPMASMTGAPKIEAMRQIDAVEGFSRGWYSGALGYVDPQGNADFNVLIRTAILTNPTATRPTDNRAGTPVAAERPVRYAQATVGAGSALTLAAQPVPEWEECQLKASKLLGVLTQTQETSHGH